MTRELQTSELGVSCIISSIVVCPEKTLNDGVL